MLVLIQKETQPCCDLLLCFSLQVKKILNTNRITLAVICLNFQALMHNCAKGDQCFWFPCFGRRRGLVETLNICFIALWASHYGSIFCQTRFSLLVGCELLLSTTFFSAPLWIVAVMTHGCCCCHCFCHK